MQGKPYWAGLGAALLLNTAFAQPIEEVVISAGHDSRTITIVDSLTVSPDIAELLNEAPGASVNRNGPLTGIPQYRGLYGQRIAVSLNGHSLAPAGPNWMDPPLSYMVTAQLESLELYRGIAPVSVAQESLGGAIDAQTRRLDFSESADFRTGGKLAGSAQSISGGYQLDADFQASNRHHRFKLAGMLQEGDDAGFPGGDILPSRYERQRYDLGYGFRWGDHSLQFDYGLNDTGKTGTPALAMDIDYFDGDLYDLSYRYDGAGPLAVSASLYARNLDHGMTNYHLRPAPAATMARRNTASTENSGFALEASLRDTSGLWRLGADGFREQHQSDIDNPRQAMFFVDNFNDAERQILGLYLEREQPLNESWRGELGLRLNRVMADSGEVDGSPAMLMPPARALRDSFNDARRRQVDHNVDLVAKLHYRQTRHAKWYLGLAQKQRSPSYQERYLWLPLEATAGLADGQLYIGDIELAAERSRVIEFGLDYERAGLSLSPRLFYNRIDDYIQGVPLGAMHPATMLVRMMNSMNGTRRPDPLQFANVEAALYGFDMDWALSLDRHWSLSGLVNIVRGERRDSDDHLYRVAPPNMRLRLHYRRDQWEATLENVLFAPQERVSASNREQESAGYGTVNLYGSWQPTAQLQLGAGVENLFDRRYRSHLGGYNRVANPDIAVGERLPGYGINVFARAVYSF